MGCDITCEAQKRIGDRWETLPVEFYVGRSYAVFGFMADVRNYSASPVISKARGFPHDYKEDDYDHYHASWLTVDEMLHYDYDLTFENRRSSGGTTLPVGSGTDVVLHEFLGKGYFEGFMRLHKAGADRIVFWFDC